MPGIAAAVFPSILLPLPLPLPFAIAILYDYIHLGVTRDLLCTD
jgi:hypothetical protein